MSLIYKSLNRKLSERLLSHQIANSFSFLRKSLYQFQPIHNSSSVEFIKTDLTQVNKKKLKRLLKVLKPLEPLNEDDLIESFSKGSGPGGQAVNKTNNAVSLIHKPTGIRVQSHLTRSRELNRIEARKILLEKVDFQMNKGNSRIEKMWEIERNKKRVKLKKQKQKQSKQQSLISSSNRVEKQQDGDEDEDEDNDKDDEFEEHEIQEQNKNQKQNKQLESND
ncbi:RF-1 domain-containing protein [Phakopsora pachyrhizi]|uniref:RF-1 domain-domain-containing protein n=1 Tax=Phakopsora pachyrhizi TaxID=170000 RepID=A0AAV0BN35_PHAPC|nr:RF-1 domain-containing protein [Phakopsora pachyrhizi]CAH7688067.1 RF-1 domain-domain-containing protein [Phakopsora pachyrhizi]